MPHLLFEKLPRIANHSQRHLPLHKPLFCQVETTKERISFVYEQVDGRRWGQLCLKCTRKVDPDEELALKTQFNLDKGFTSGYVMDFEKVQQLVTGRDMTKAEFENLVNFMRSAQEKTCDADKLKLEFYRSLLRVDYRSLSRLLPEFMKGNKKTRNF